MDQHNGHLVEKIWQVVRFDQIGDPHVDEPSTTADSYYLPDVV